jgi:hypothetical protein
MHQRQETNVDLIKDGRFFSQLRRPPIDWELLLPQLEAAYRKETNAFRRERLHYNFVEYLEQERWAYQDELLRSFKMEHRDKLEEWPSDAQGELAKAKHWAKFRADYRSTLDWLGRIEERLDAIFIRAIEQSVGGA